MAKKKKTNNEKVCNKFAHDIDSILFLLYDLKDDAFKGEITHNELIERLFDVCSKMNTACETFEESRWED